MQLVYYYNLAIDSNQDVLYSNRALCFLAENRFMQAKYDLNKCLSINPRNIKAMKRLAQLYISFGNLGVHIN